jgi:nucleotide-binding universal stress UspA family protein
MFRDILVPLDGSRFAEAALPLAARIARSAGARLHLMLVHEPMVPLSGMGGVPIPALNLDEEMMAREHSYLADLAARWREPSGRPLAVRSIEGRAGPDVCEEANRLSADLVVMTTHGRGTLRRLWLGSVADHVIRHLTVPVLLVPRRNESQLPAEHRLRHLLVALDLSRDAEAILKPVTMLAGLTQAELTLIYIAESLVEIPGIGVPGPVLENASPAAAMRAYAEGYLEQLAGKLRAKDIRTTTRVATDTSAAEGLLGALDHEAFDGIAMTTHGVGGFRRFLLGSVADKVIRSATKPVLVLRPASGV